MRIAVIGTGYVGLPTGVGLAELGNAVTCIDCVESKVAALRAGRITLYEKGLKEIFDKNTANGRLHFTTSMSEGVSRADVVMVAVGTPPHPETGEADLRYIYAAVEELAAHLTGYTVVAIKSTVPVGTGDEVERRIRAVNPGAEVDVVSLPEFLREGFAVQDFFDPDRIVVGTESKRARTLLGELYAPLDSEKIMYVKRRSSEAIKYASNAFLAIKIHYINEMANFCERAGADIREVARGMGADSRIGGHFLRPGPGYGGSCFPKDTKAMVHMAAACGVDMSLIRTAIEGNARRAEEMAERIIAAVKDIENPKIAALGLAFKDGTDDCRESPAVDIIIHLVERGLEVTVYDPQAMNTARALLGERVSYAADMYAPLEGADALATLTEWPDFRTLDLARAAILMRHKTIIDLRNLIPAEKAQQEGFSYHGIG